jgi:hypothetical protein
MFGFVVPPAWVVSMTPVEPPDEVTVTLLTVPPVAVGVVPPSVVNVLEPFAPPVVEPAASVPPVELPPPFVSLPEQAVMT